MSNFLKLVSGVFIVWVFFRFGSEPITRIDFSVLLTTALAIVGLYKK